MQMLDYPGRFCLHLLYIGVLISFVYEVERQIVIIET